MFWKLVTKELHDHLFSLRTSLSFLACLILVAIAVVILKEDYKQQVSEYNMKVATSENLSNRETGFAHRPVSRLLTLFRGFGDNAVQSARLNMNSEMNVEENLNRNPMFALFPMVDGTFIIGVVMSLLAILFTYDAVCGEKEKATLKLVLSGPVPRGLVLLGKWLGGYLSLLVPCLVSLLIGLLILSVDPMVQLRGQDWADLGGILGVSLIYLSVFFTLGLLISSVAHRSATSILALLLIWVLFVMVIPNISPYVAEAVYKIPTKQKLEEDKRQAWNDHYVELKAKHAKGAEEARKIKFNREDWRNNPRWPERWKIWWRIEKQSFLDRKNRMERINESFRNKLDVQMKIAKTIAFLSPYACFIFSINTLAGTGIENEKHFIAAAETFDRTYFDYFHYSGYKEKNGWPVYDVEHKPVFVYKAMSLAEKVEASKFEIVVLLLFNGLLFLGTYISFLRYDVR